MMSSWINTSFKQNGHEIKINIRYLFYYYYTKYTRIMRIYKQIRNVFILHNKLIKCKIFQVKSKLN